MELRYTKDASLLSKGLYFTKGKTFKVDDKVGEYLLKTFGDAFEEIKPKKAAPKEPTKPKATTNRKASPKKEG